MKIGGDRRQACDTQRRVGRSHGEKRVVPIDLHAGANPHMMIGGGEFPREVDDHHLVFAGGEAQVLDNGPPVSGGIADGE